jgi:hypothetical protein
VLNLISMPIIDALLLCHVSWVIGIESGPKRLVLARDMRSRSWPNIDGTYGMCS